MVLLRLCWWIKGWKEGFPYSADEVLRNPSCLFWMNLNLRSPPTRSLSRSLARDLVPKGKSVWLVEVSLNAPPNISVIGGALLNENNELLCLFSGPIPAMDYSSAMVLAIHRAVQISLSSDRFRSFSIEIWADSQMAANWCSSASGGPVNLNLILNFIRSTPSRGLKLTISAKHQHSFSVADLIAKQKLFRNSEFVVWNH
ncbi:uncharacterized protein LOC104889900 [Beta vulgaris subsp. vulgaris]|uniref:uncharacterized protein LOC104889900 n=1 Tax=Beta vulgaris subsp. vulgaris TaxID=3555 RepID=UPI00053F32B5|nr:uncharacterized protein LOC104889900 [Beta vulgaris subsp. vulgaris]